MIDDVPHDPAGGAAGRDALQPGNRTAMIRLLGVGAGHGFGDRSALTASRVQNMIAAALTIGSLSLCLIVSVAALSIRLMAA
ncbi:MAG: hypothetical protein AB1586_14330 [Pseudomonadota bacterium]